METNKKMLFFDIDGTLITNDKRKIMPDSAKTAIKQAQENGHLAFINTGRVITNVDDFIRDIGFDGFVCGCGTYIYADGQELFHNVLPQKRCYDIAKKARECNIMAIFEYAEHTAFDSEIPEVEDSEVLTYFRNMKRKIVDDINSPEFIFDKLAAWYSEDNTRVGEFKEYVKDDFDCIDREGNFMEIIPRGFSKATGIQFLMDYYNVPLENVYVFGDSNNDLDMLKYAPNSVAMGESTPEVYEAAAYTTDTVMENGIYNAMKHFGVI